MTYLTDDFSTIFVDDFGVKFGDGSLDVAVLLFGQNITISGGSFNTGTEIMLRGGGESHVSMGGVMFHSSILTPLNLTGQAIHVSMGTLEPVSTLVLTGHAIHVSMGQPMPLMSSAGMTIGAFTVTGLPQENGDTGVTMRYSNSGGQNWQKGIIQDLGAEGEYGTILQWRNQGLSRSMVYELSWSCPFKTSLAGATIATEAAGT